MGKSLKLGVLAFACLMAFGCSAKHTQHEDYSMRAAQEQRFRRSYEAVFDSNSQQANQQLLRKARSAIGTPYVPGGMSPGGFDCSGFVCWAYKSVGVNLPRTAREQSVVGKRINNVEDMQVGDIVAFRHPRRGYHTGIYVGDGKFIHSPHRRTTVRINSLDDPYFRGTFLGARRIKMDGTENLVAEAESRLSDFAEEKAVRDISRKHSSTSSRGKVAEKERNRKDSDSKKPSKSREKFVEVASLDKSHQSSRKIDVQKSEKTSDRSSAKSSEKSSAKSSEKSSAKSSKDVRDDSRSKAGSSKHEASKSEHKTEASKAATAKSEPRKSSEHKAETAKNESKSGGSKSQASKSDSGKQSKASADKGKADHDKVVAKSDNNKKNPAKKREKDS